MNMKNLISFLLLALLIGCSQSFYMQGKKHLDQNQYDSAIDAFYKELQVNPSNFEAWRELGVAFYKQGNLIKAEDALKQANNIKPDGRTNLFLGLVYEKQEMWDRALQAYGTSLNLKPGGKTASMTRAHLDRLQKKKIEQEIARALENEAAISVDTIPSNTIAVSRLDGSSLPPDLQPLALGLTDFIASDLAKVRSLRVVERQKLNAILNELELSASAAVDPATAPRIGRLLGSHKVVTGTVVGLGDEGIRIDGAVVYTGDGELKQSEAVEGDLEKIFQIEKDMVFRIIDTLGITLSPEERDAIEEVPTESYLAFLAYSRGLEYERQGMYAPAQQQFNQALQIDAGFQAAQQELQASAGAAEAGASYGESLETLETTALSETVSEADLAGLDSRLVTVINNAGLGLGVDDGDIANEDPQTGGTGTVVVRGTIDD